MKMRTKLHKFSVAIDATLLQQARYVVYTMTGITLAGLAREGLKRELQRLARKRGRSFPKLSMRLHLSPGRPRKAKPV